MRSKRIRNRVATYRTADGRRLKAQKHQSRPIDTWSSAPRVRSNYGKISFEKMCIIHKKEIRTMSVGQTHAQTRLNTRKTVLFASKFAQINPYLSRAIRDDL